MTRDFELPLEQAALTTEPEIGPSWIVVWTVYCLFKTDPAGKHNSYAR